MRSNYASSLYFKFSYYVKFLSTYCFLLQVISALEPVTLRLFLKTSAIFPSCWGFCPPLFFLQFKFVILLQFVCEVVSISGKKKTKKRKEKRRKRSCASKDFMVIKVVLAKLSTSQENNQQDFFVKTPKSLLLKPNADILYSRSETLILINFKGQNQIEANEHLLLELLWVVQLVLVGQY